MKFLKTLFGQTKVPAENAQISLSDFRDRVLLGLNEQAPDIKVIKNDMNVAVLDVSSPDGIEGKSDLTNSYKDLTLFNGPLDEALQKAADSILVAVRPTKTVSSSDLLPLIRTSAYLGSASDETRAKISRPFCGELLEICMADLPTALRGLTDDDLAQLKTPEPLLVARENMCKLLPMTYKDDSLGFADLYSIEDNAHLAPSLVLFEEFWNTADEAYPNGCIIALPRRDQLFLIDLSDPKAVENAQHLVRVTFEDDFNLLTPELYVRKAGVISILNVV